MTSSHRGRLRALAAGGVLALAAGVLAAAPSSAAPQHLIPGSAPARPAAGPAADSDSEAAPRSDRQYPSVVLPGRATPLARVAAAAPPRHDVDGDGISDMIVMEYDQSTGVYLSSISSWSDYAIYKTDPESSFKDLLPVGDVGGTTKAELLSLSFDGVLTLYEAGLKSTSAPLWSGRGWQKYNRLVATGDVTGDHRPDLLARDHAGDLWLYTGTGSVSNPFNTRVKVGSGWGIYDQIVGASDVDGDGLGDVLTRTLTGELWFHKGSGSATAPLKARVKVGTGWNAYNAIVGAGDYSGDGRPDVLARDTSGRLFLYKGTGTSTAPFAAREQVATGWNVYDMLVVPGDIDGDSKGDVLARLPSGDMYLYTSTGNAGTATFTARVKFGTGWNIYKNMI
ncbi:FG-GAP repeat domain-containing protein [Streptomyces sp. NPDC059989]|uniref:FG-GAP repeat domain-containing protein n=1 Tax=Streptomyces sp. NPDC059989 TaxID=3347026 RepID=UPI00367B857E